MSSSPNEKKSDPPERTTLFIRRVDKQGQRLPYLKAQVPEQFMKNLLMRSKNKATCQDRKGAIRKELRIFLGFFLVGLVLIVGSFAFYHFVQSAVLTIEQALNPKSAYHIVSSLFKCLFFAGFGVWLLYPVYLVIKLIKK